MEYKIIHNKFRVTVCVLQENNTYLLERNHKLRYDSKTEISVRSNSTLHLMTPKFHCN